MTARTRAEELRRVANLSTRRLTAAREAFDAFTEDIGSIKDAADVIESVDLASIAGSLSELFDGISGLVELGLIDEDLVTELDTSACWFGTLAEDSEGMLGADRFASLTEAYDALETALDEYETVKESERYDGKSEDLESAWDEVTSSMEALADAADDLNLDEKERGVA